MVPNKLTTAAARLMIAPVKKSLKSLKLIFCDHSGSSVGARAYITDPMKIFTDTFKNITVSTEKRSGRHPFVLAEYENGVVHQWGLRNKTAPEISDVFQTLRERGGRKMSSFKAWTSTKTRTPSIQGPWRSGLFPAPLVLVNLKHLTPTELETARKDTRSSVAHHPDMSRVTAISDKLRISGGAQVAIPVILGPRIATLTTVRGPAKTPTKRSTKAKSNAIDKARIKARAMLIKEAKVIGAQAKL